MGFIHLHIHSHFSEGWGTSTLDELLERAKRCKIDKFALTDTNNLCGMVEFIKGAEEKRIEPIIGSEIVHEKRRALLLVKNQKGYENLCKIISDRNCNQDFDIVSSIEAHREGLVVISDDFSLLRQLKRHSLDDLYVELSPGYRMASCYAFSRESKIPPVATNRVYMAKKEDYYIHRILRAIYLKSALSMLSSSDTCKPHNYLIHPSKMVELFSYAPSAIKNTEKIAKICSFIPDMDKIIFPSFRGMSDENAFKLLYRLTLEGCKKRYGKITPKIKERIEYEMRIIRERRFASYFLVVWDTVRRFGISCGRGSAAASIVSYALEITHVDPIRHNLFFDRFLNTGRVDPPDIDVDFPWDQREEIIESVFTRYGSIRVALVANHNTFGARAAIREVARVFGLPEEEINRVTSRVGWDCHIKELGEGILHRPEMRGIKLDPIWKKIIKVASKIEDHFYHLSTHCGGVVIVPDEIKRYCPVQVSRKGFPVLQWEKDSVEDAGLVKIDILGNRSLAVIRDAIDMINRNYGNSLNYTSLNPLDDPETLKIFYDARTMGVFYFESPATRQVLTKVASGFSFERYQKMDHFHLNVIITSIIRPASNRSIREWVLRLHGKPWDVPHPLLKPILQETLGVMVFQEQLSQAAMNLAGFDSFEADTLRKVVSKKHRHKKLRDFYERFLKGAKERGVPLKIIDEVWEMIMGFDGYSFCKPHSASYTLVAYKSAYLKAHFPAEFMAAVISNQGGYYSTYAYISEAKRMGLRVLPPCINQGQIRYTGKGDTVRVGFMQLSGLSKETQELILYDRDKRGPYKSFIEFLGRLGPKIPFHDIIILIRAGCFDGIEKDIPRSELIWKALKYYSKRRHALNFRGIKPGKIVPSGLKKELRDEIEIFGFPISCHPLDLFCPYLKGINYISSQKLNTDVGRDVTLIGWLITDKLVHSRDGKPMEFLTFEDRDGVFEAVMFPKIYRKFCHLLSAPGPYLLKGRVEEDQGAISLNLTKIEIIRPCHLFSASDSLVHKSISRLKEEQEISSLPGRQTGKATTRISQGSRAILSNAVIANEVKQSHPPSTPEP
ncbi:MAG TPA: DNA polymerase III subunit alpha [Desulfobacteraceae bacterium]|nr:DNA polymerase III subunit alpha [Desulfobacteraceae bacterium]